MTNRMRTIAWMLAASLPMLAPARPAQAQAPDGPFRERGWEWNLSAGAMRQDPFLRDFLNFGPAATSFAGASYQRRINPVIEGRVGYHFNENWSLSLSLNDGIGSQVKYLNLGETITYSMNLDGSLSPFLMLGTDLTRITGQNGRVTHDTWGAHAGVGIRKMIGDAIALRVEARVQSQGYREVGMNNSTTWAPLGLIGLSFFTGGHGPDVVSVPCPACKPTTIVRVDTVRMARVPVRVDTVRIVRVDTVQLPPIESADQLVLRVQFRTNRTELLPISYPVLNGIAAAIKTTGDSRWVIEGHTDSIGTKAANLKLSQGRAQTVLDYLVSQGVPRVELEARGYGETRPIFSNKDLAGRAANRRVQLRRRPAPPTEKVP